MSTETTSNPYILTNDRIQDAPRSFREKLKYLGPGFILSASIVGSGELIATTTLGAHAGFITFWVILISCVVKVAVQIEFARHIILTGESPMVAFNKLPGPIFGKARWTVWSFFFLLTTKILQVGGIIGGVAIILNIAIPGISVTIWAFITAIAVALMIYQGYYRFIERFSVVMIGLFTLFTLASLYFLKFTDFAITWPEVASGLTFELPTAMVAVTLGAFGITGVGGDEIIAYGYWCLEKGYAARSGKPYGDAGWADRARGWIRVMYLDATLAMIVYTLVTAAFYLLGAAVLHAQGEIPEGYGMVESLSGIYTESLGPGAKNIFFIGAFVVLFSTLFAALAGWTRQFSDIFGQLGWIDFFDERQRRRSIALLAWFFPFAWATVFVFIKLPVAMVMIGGVITSIILFLVLFAVFNFRYYRLDPQFKPTKLYDTALWISMLFIVFVGVYGVVQLF